MTSNRLTRYEVQKKTGWLNTHCFPSWLRLWSFLLLREDIRNTVQYTNRAECTCENVKAADTAPRALPLPPKQKQKRADAPAKLLPEPCGYPHTRVGLDNETDIQWQYHQMNDNSSRYKSSGWEGSVTMPSQTQQRAKNRRKQYLIKQRRWWCWRIICLISENKTSSNLPSVLLNSSAFLGLPSYPDAEEVLQLPGRKF